MFYVLVVHDLIIPHLLSVKAYFPLGNTTTPFAGQDRVTELAPTAGLRYTNLMKFFIGCGAILTQGGKFILIQEVRHEKTGFYNLPAGTLEVDEDLIGCITREAKEETGADVNIEHLVGIYQTVMPSGNVLFTVFAGNVPEDAVLQSDEHEVIRALTYEEIMELHRQGKLRSPIVMKCIEDYTGGQKFPLTAVQAWHTDALSSITVEVDH